MNLTAHKQSQFTAGNTVLGVQFLFVAFGATVLVPLLVGIDPAVALFTAGIGTLIFHLITKGMVPIFLGSSFAFIAPIIESSGLYGLIASVGIKTLVDAKTDMGKTRSQLIVSLILTVGIGGAVVSWGTFSLSGIGLASVVGIILNLILPQEKK